VRNNPPPPLPALPPASSAVGTGISKQFCSTRLLDCTPWQLHNGFPFKTNPLFPGVTSHECVARTWGEAGLLEVCIYKTWEIGQGLNLSSSATSCGYGASRSKTIQNLPPVLASLMKSTEPWSDDYYAHDVEASMREAGFTRVVCQEADHRHRVLLGFRSP
jgi:hypothetical protein